MAQQPSWLAGNGGEEEPGDENLPDMQTLLEDEGLAVRGIRRGDIVEGTVVGLSRDGLLLDVGTKSEGLVPLNEMHSLGPEGPQRFRPGDKTLAWVLQPETREGQILLSIDRARGEQGWRTLQDLMEQGESFEADVVGHNRGGLIVNAEGLPGFVPLSQVASIRTERGDQERIEASLASLEGKRLRLKVLELNRRRNRIILSERAAEQEWRSQQKDRLLAELKEGDIRKGRITSIRDFGIFVDLGGADGLVHLSEISWDRSKSPQELFRLGDEIDVYVLRVDPDTKRIALSIRRAQADQWGELIDHYQVGQIVTGQVTKLADFGAFARVEGPLEGLIHVSELTDRRISHPREVVKEGDILPLKIVRIERDRHRLGLSLKQARSEAEAMGYVFNEAGGIALVPQDLARKFPQGNAEASASDDLADSPDLDLQ